MSAEQCCGCPAEATVAITLTSGRCAALCAKCLADTARPSVYFVRGGDLVKIGFSANVTQRLGDLRIGSPVKLELWHVCAGGRDLERALHERFAKDRSHGEWFRVSDEIADFVSRAREREAVQSTPETGR